MIDHDRIKAKDVSSTWLNRKMKDFPLCGVRYGSDNGHGFVLINPSLPVSSMKLIAEKIEAASIKAYKSINVLIIPRQLAKAKGLTLIPTLTDAV